MGTTGFAVTPQPGPNFHLDYLSRACCPRRLRSRINFFQIRPFSAGRESIRDIALALRLTLIIFADDFRYRRRLFRRATLSLLRYQRVQISFPALLSEDTLTIYDILYDHNETTYPNWILRGPKTNNNTYF